MRSYPGVGVAVRIRRAPVTNTPPVAGQVLVASGSPATWTPGTVAPSSLTPYTAQTTDGAAWVTLMTVPLDASQGVLFFPFLLAARTDGIHAGDVALLFGNQMYQRIGNAAPAVNAAYQGIAGGEPTVNPPLNTTIDAVVTRFAVSGNSVLLQVQGVAGATIRWTTIWSAYGAPFSYFAIL